MRGEVHGLVTARHDTRVERTIKGSRIVRNGSAANPAYDIDVIGGGTVLKLGSELTLG